MVSFLITFLQVVAVRCNVLQGAANSTMLVCLTPPYISVVPVLQCVAVCCRQDVATCDGSNRVYSFFTPPHASKVRVLQCVAVNVLQYAAVTNACLCESHRRMQSVVYMLQCVVVTVLHICCSHTCLHYSHRHTHPCVMYCSVMQSMRCNILQ